MFDSQPTTCTLYGVGTGGGGAASAMAGLSRPDASESESCGQETHTVEKKNGTPLESVYHLF